MVIYSDSLLCYNDNNPCSSEKGVKMATNVKSERLDQIIQILRERNGASIKQLAHRLGVTEMTIRRDLESLRINNIINLVHGAAIYNPNAENTTGDVDYPAMKECGIMDAEKSRIGKAAAKLVVPGDVIFVDTGTTTVQLIKYLPAGLPITLACFTMNALSAVQKKNVEHLVFVGGYYHYNTQMFESPEAIQMIQRMRATKAFISAAGIDKKLGLTCVHQYEVSTKQACVETAQQKILLADSSKFDTVTPAYFGELSQIDTIITDNGITQEWQDFLLESGINLTIV